MKRDTYSLFSTQSLLELCVCVCWWSETADDDKRYFMYGYLDRMSTACAVLSVVRPANSLPCPPYLFPANGSNISKFILIGSYYYCRRLFRFLLSFSFPQFFNHELIGRLSKNPERILDGMMQFPPPLRGAQPDIACVAGGGGR